MIKQETQVKSISDDELSDILAIPGASNIIASTDEKKSVLTDEEKEAERILNESNNSKSAEEIADEEKLKQEEEAERLKIEAEKKAKLLDAENKGASVLDEHVNEEGEEEEDLEKNKGTGRPKLDKSLIAETVSDLIKEGVLFDFEYEAGKEKKLEDYTKQDYIDLIKGNFENKE